MYYSRGQHACLDRRAGPRRRLKHPWLPLLRLDTATVTTITPTLSSSSSSSSSVWTGWAHKFISVRKRSLVSTQLCALSWRRGVIANRRRRILLIDTAARSLCDSWATCVNWHGASTTWFMLWSWPYLWTAEGKTPSLSGSCSAETTCDDWRGVTYGSRRVGSVQ